MSANRLALARRAVACPEWRWTAGMLTHEGYRLVRPRGAFWVCAAHDRRGMGRALGLRTLNLRGSYPDLDDAATRGCLLALVREAWNEPRAVAIFCEAVYPGQMEGWAVQRADGRVPLNGEWQSEAEALVAALEAAP